MTFKSPQSRIFRPNFDKIIGTLVLSLDDGAQKKLDFCQKKRKLNKSDNSHILDASRKAPVLGENLNSDASKPKQPPLDQEIVRDVYEKHRLALERFLLGVLREEAAAADALQTTFARLLEKGHTVQQQDSLKSWLFRVAFNEAMLIRRKESISRKHAEHVAWRVQTQSGADKGVDQRLSQSVHYAIQQEDIKRVREALTRLPESQRVVVEKRIYDGLKFREIAVELDVPLGTVLARMQAGLRKLKPILKSIDID